MNFASDNVYGVDQRIMAAMVAANVGTDASYAYDDGSKECERQLSLIFEKEVRTFLVVSGSAANGLALSALVPSYGAVFCHAEAHIAVDECNLPEFYTGGAKIIGLEGPAGKINPDVIAKALKGFVKAEHDPKPAAVSLTNATELGAVYSPADVQAIADLIKPRGMKLHMDGARFANALVGLGCTPAELTWKSGVDVMSFGATKNGAMMLEAVIFFDTSLAEDFLYRRMRSGQLISKGRFLSAQMLSYLKNGVWLENAQIANDLAQELAAGLLAINNIRIPNPVQANEVFAIIPRTLNDALLAAGAKYYDWMPDSLGGQITEDEIFVRFVLSFATPKEDVSAILQLIRRLTN